MVFIQNFLTFNPDIVVPKADRAVHKSSHTVRLTENASQCMIPTDSIRTLSKSIWVELRFADQTAANDAASMASSIAGNSHLNSNLGIPNGAWELDGGASKEALGSS